MLYMYESLDCAEVNLGVGGRDVRLWALVGAFHFGHVTQHFHHCLFRLCPHPQLFVSLFTAQLLLNLTVYLTSLSTSMFARIERSGFVYRG